MTFNFPKVTLKQVDVSDADLTAIASKKPVIAPGQQSLKVVALENRGPSDKDPDFIKVSITFEAVNKAQIRDFFLVPTTSLRYKGASGKSGELFPLQKLMGLFESLGEKPTTADIPVLIGKYFGKSKLVGENIEAVVGYKKDHVKFISAGLFAVADRDDNPYLDENGNYAVTGTDRQSCENNALLKDMVLHNWPEIMKYIPGTTDADDSESVDF